MSVLIAVKDGILTITPSYPYKPSQTETINQFIRENFPDWLKNGTEFLKYRHTSYKWYFTIGGRDYLFHRSKMNHNVKVMQPFRIKNGIPMDVPALDTYYKPHGGICIVEKW